MKNTSRRTFHKKWIFYAVMVLIPAGTLVFLIFSHRPQVPRSYLQTLEGLAFNKYLDAPVDFENILHSGGWDGYFLSAPEYQCVLGGDYGLLTHAGEVADKTVFWLQPGEECWPDHPNCGKPDPYTDEQAFAALASGANGGPFGPISPDPDNPVAKWNYILVPTCDGSFHFGDAAADYDADGAPDHFHNGLRQTSAAVSLMKRLFPQSRQILIAGSSNGGFGTFGATPIVRLAFPQARLYVWNDSGPGLFRTKAPAVWPQLIQTWNLTPMLPADCPKCREQLIYLFDWMLERDPRLKIAMYSSYQDGVVSQVVGLSGEEHEQLLRSISGEIQRKHSDTFKRYFILGDSHCIADYYNQVDGVTLWMWLDAFIHDQAGWKDILQGG